MKGALDYKLIIILVLLAVIAAMAIFIVVKIKKNNSNGTSSAETFPKDENVKEEPTEEKQYTANPIIVEGIKKYASNFDGLYESLYQTGIHTETFLTDAYVEWCDRIRLLVNEEEFVTAFNNEFQKNDISDEESCREKIATLLSCIDAAGICRHCNTEERIVFDDVNKNAYVNIEGGKPKIGIEYIIFKSAWLMGEKVIEYGMVMPVTQNAN